MSIRVLYYHNSAYKTSVDYVQVRCWVSLSQTVGGPREKRKSFKASSGHWATLILGYSLLD